MKNYKNKRCWQATTQVNLRKGTVIEQKLEKNGWLMLYIQWDKLDPTWEKALNISFDLKQIGEK
jgi:hypothetical protein